MPLDGSTRATAQSAPTISTVPVVPSIRIASGRPSCDRVICSSLSD